MKFDVYYPIKTKSGKFAPGLDAHPMTIHEIWALMNNDTYIGFLNEVRSGQNKESKMKLPAVCWTGISSTGKRYQKNMIPTQFVMADIDKCKDANGCWNAFLKQATEEDFLEEVVLAHYTPSMGVRIVFKAQEQFKTLQENLEWFYDHFKMEEWGKPDKGIHNLDRVSFLVPFEDFLYNNLAFLEEEKPADEPLKNAFFESDLFNGEGGKEESTPVSQNPTGEQLAKELEEQLEEQKACAMDYRGTPVGVIVNKWVEVQGEPSAGEVHNYYNEMVKYFRNIMSNNQRALLAWLPRFGHSKEECKSQIKSICRVDTLSSHPKPFYYFLKNNGFYTPKEYEDPKLKKYIMEGVKNESVPVPPYLPPIFKEFCEIAPRDFVIPTITALMPVLGTLTSYVQAEYPYDARMHTTSFFSVIYAPAGTGKGFVERLIDILFEDLRLRDAISSARENIYLRVINKKGANEKSPDMPHVSLRIIPAKNSEAEFLSKQADNKGYHMFTYAAEMDSWAKGVKAAGGSKDDMIRVAWDNGTYGQQFRSANTFKGEVRLYWNVLITGTLPQLEAYFKNVENGLVTRCAFSPIENQEFALPPRWKNLNKRALAKIRKFMDRCDKNTYTEPCLVDPQMLAAISDEDFDKQIKWRFEFKERQTLDCSWIMPTIDAFHKEQMELASRNLDDARDVFRRRAGVRGFRLALICMCLKEHVAGDYLKKCAEFINWWMHVDLEMSLKLWGAKYNELATAEPSIPKQSIFDELKDEFDRADLYAVTKRQHIKTPLPHIIYQWKKISAIEETTDKDHFKKISKNGKSKSRNEV